MKEIGVGLVSENQNEARIMTSKEFLDTLMYEYNQIRIVISRDKDNIVFESTRSNEIANAKELLTRILNRENEHNIIVP